MSSVFLTETSDCLSINKSEYLSQLSFSSSRIRQDKKIELDMKQEYSGRELYEMIQNADDEGSPRIELTLTEDNYLHIKNWGNRPFTEGGLLSIMRSFLSTKTDAAYKSATVKPIGNKGLGFRSLLNWSDEITIHTNGVMCSFSKDIAQKNWENIKQIGKDNGVLSETDLNLFEQEHSGNLPLPILSIPKVDPDTITSQNSFDVNGACTTDIEVHCKELSVVEDIKQKLYSLPCSVLLFLRNIKQIDISCKGGKRTIKRIETNDVVDKYPQEITIKDNNNDIKFVVNKYLSEDRSYEVGVAYPLTQFETNLVLYSYFPTEVRLDVPAIYHGTFELNASRNHLVDTEQNKIVLEKLGEVAIQLANHLTSNGLLEEHNKWDSFNLLNLSISDIESAKLSPLAESIKSNLDSANILPVVKSVFSNIGSALKIGDKLASWLISVQGKLSINESLSNHIINTNEKVFSPERYLSNDVLLKIKKSLDDSSEWLEEIARQTMTIEQRADLIDAITECGISVKKLSILIDAEGTIIDANKDNPSYILSMKGNSVLPECLHVRSVDSKLVNMLQRKWNVQIRQVTEMLKPATTVADGDHYTLRRRIESWSSSQQMDIEGMCEVLKWEFHNPTQDSTPFTSDMCLINKNGERKNACNLILEETSFPNNLANKIDSKWWLKYSLSEWKEILDANTDDETADFLHKVLGVSQRVPVQHLYYGDNDKYLEDVRDSNNKSQIGNNYCNNFGVNNNKTKQYNYAYVPYEDFLSQFKLSEALGLILTDERAFQNIMNNSISLFYRSSKAETVLYSYSAYKIRYYKQFSHLQNFVINSSVFGCDIDFDYLEKTLSIDRITKINPLLVSLGAQTSINNFTLKQLYSLLSQEVNPVGIQKRYKELREAIRNKNEEDRFINEIRTKHLTNVWARIQGQLKWLNVEDVYYWDNDQLPQTILSNLPKLEIGNRVGEESVAKIFGVKLAKNIAVSFSNNNDNENLTRDLKKYLSERIKYFLAYRIGDDIKDTGLIQQSVKALRNLSSNLHIYLSSSYSINGEINGMENGDILTSLNKGVIHYHICSTHQNCINAIEDPVFCENLNEAVCMALKVTSSTMSNYFRNIITHDIRYIEYIAKKDIAPEIWTLTLKSLGLSEFEQRFWEAYSYTQETKIDISQLAEHIIDERDYILSIYKDLDLPEDYTGITDMKPFEQYRLLLSMQVKDSLILGADGLKTFYTDYFNAIRNGYSNQYNSSLYQKYANLIAENKQQALDYIKEYQHYCQLFSEPFYEDEVEKIKQRLLKEEELTNIMNKMIKDKFKFEPNNVVNLCVHNTILPEYEKILSDYHLSEGSLDQLDALIAKFKGLEDLFKERLNKYLNSDSLERDKNKSEQSIETVSIDYANCHSILRNISSDIKNKKGRKTNGGYTSDREKYHAGKKAELATFEAMKASADYEDVFGHSSILNKEGGNDNLHYDISYRKKGTPKTDTRYLEVKAMSGNTIIMSCMEYQFAKEHCEQYDFAIYHDGKVSIIESPFSTKNGKNCFEVQPETYQITLEWD